MANIIGNKGVLYNIQYIPVGKKSKTVRKVYL